MMGKEGERLINGTGTIQPCIFVPQVINKRREVARKVGRVCHKISQNKKCQFFHEISCSKHNMVYILNSELAQNALK